MVTVQITAALTLRLFAKNPFHSSFQNAIFKRLTFYKDSVFLLCVTEVNKFELEY